MNSSSSSRIPTFESSERFSSESKLSQTESYVLDIPTETFKKLFFSPKFDYSRVMPSFIKSHTLINGVKRSEGSLERIDYSNGTFVEFLTKKSDSKELEVIYEVSKTDIPFMRDVEKVTHVFRFTPITFSGCLLETVLLEDESSRSSSKPSPKTMVEWTTRLSSELKEDDMRKLRDFKLNLVSDFMRDIAMERVFDKVKSDSSESYLKRKLESSDKSSGKSSERTYSIETARKDAERIRGEKI